MKAIKIKRILLLVCLCVFVPLLYSNSSSTNHARVIDISSKSLNFNLYISDKLVGGGEMSLSFEKEKITGTALGESIINQYKVDLLTNIEGALDLKHRKISVNIHGTGNTNGIFAASKITYHGPLKGQINDKLLKLVGVITIKGKLAKLAGLCEKEPITIEVLDPLLLSWFAHK